MVATPAEQLRASLEAAGLGEHADAVCGRLDELIAAPSHHEQLRLLQECGVHKLGQRLKARATLQALPATKEPLHATKEPLEALPALKEPLEALAVLKEPLESMMDLSDVADAPYPVAAGPQRWRVVHIPAVVVRSAPSLTASKRGMRAVGSEVSVAYVENGWARLDGGEESWMLVDGTLAGFAGPLLRWIPPEVARTLDAARSLVRDALNLVPSDSGGAATAAAALRLPLGACLPEALSKLQAALDALMALPADHRVVDELRAHSEMAVLHARVRPEYLLLPLLECQAVAQATVGTFPQRSSSGVALPECPLLSTPPAGEHAEKLVALHSCAWEVLHASSECLKDLSSHVVAAMPVKVELAAALFLAACATVGWLNVSKPIESSALVDHVYAHVERRMAACESGGDASARALRREAWNLCVAVDPLAHAGLRAFGSHVLRLLSSADGRSELVGSSLAQPADLEACPASDWECTRRAREAIVAHADPTLNPRVFLGVFTAAEAADARIEDSAAGMDGGWDHAACGHLRGLSDRARHVLARATFLGMLTSAKKKFEHMSASRMRLPPGETGGRYHCVPPEKLLVDGFTRLMSDEAIATLQRDRIVVIDDVLPADVLAAASTEALRMDADGLLRGERISTCNPGERSTELALWEERQRAALAENHPGMHHCVRSLWNLPTELGQALDLALRVPQLVLLASYPPGAHYVRHLDSYDGQDIPRLLTVLLYLAYEPRTGGELVALNCPAGTDRTIAPLPGRLCVFYSQEIEHLVLPSVGERFALTMWLWDVRKDSQGR